MSCLDKQEAITLAAFVQTSPQLHYIKCPSSETLLNFILGYGPLEVKDKSLYKQQSSVKGKENTFPSILKARGKHKNGQEFIMYNRNG